MAQQQNDRVTLRLHPAQAQVLDDINEYLGLGDRVDTIRHLMNVGIQQVRFQQTVRQQVDVLQNFSTVLSQDFEKLAAAMAEGEKEQGQTVLPFPSGGKASKSKKRSGA